MKNVLLFRLGGLGDLLVSFPSIYLVRRKLYPCSMTLVCRKEYGHILKETGLVDDLISLDEKKIVLLFADNPFLDRDIARWLDKFSLILGWIRKRGSLKLEKDCFFSKGKKSHFFVFDPHYQGQISKFYFQKTSEFLKIERNPIDLFNECIILPLSLNQKRKGLKLLRGKPLKEGEKIVVVHPGSGSENKCWPIENFLAIIQRLSLDGLGGVIVTGVAEERMEYKLGKNILPENWAWYKAPSLLGLAGLLSHASFYLGNDSGITHLAAASGTKVVALFRKDLKVAWEPFGSVTVLSGESLDEIRLDSVWEAVSKMCLC